MNQRIGVRLSYGRVSSSRTRARTCIHHRTHVQKEPTVRAVPLGDCSQLSSITTPAKSTQHGAAAPATLSNCLTFCCPSPHASRPSRGPEINDCSILWNRSRIVSTETAAKNRGQCRDNRRRIDTRPKVETKRPRGKTRRRCAAPRRGVKRVRHGADEGRRGEDCFNGEPNRNCQKLRKPPLPEASKYGAHPLLHSHIYAWRLFALSARVCGLLNKVTWDARASLPFAGMYKESARREMTYFRYSCTFSIKHTKSCLTYIIIRRKEKKNSGINVI